MKNALLLFLTVAVLVLGYLLWRIPDGPTEAEYQRQRDALRAELQQVRADSARTAASIRALDELISDKDTLIAELSGERNAYRADYYELKRLLTTPRFDGSDDSLAARVRAVLLERLRAE